MKKTYETPSIEVVKFQYRDQVVVASGTHLNCKKVWINESPSDGTECVDGNRLESWNN
nr:hypothetical protein [Clostridia bacterium]